MARRYNMTPLEQRSKAQVEGIVKEFVDEQRKKLKQPPAAVVAVAITKL